MNLLWIAFLGLIQGITEFFPVSSSGHLTLLPYIFKFQDPGLAFDIALHLGTFFAILFALREDWINIIKSVFGFKFNEEIRLLGLLLVTAIPGAVFGVLLEEKAATVFRSPLLIAGTLIVFGIILVVVDGSVKKNEGFKDINLKKAGIIGFSQALALIPGVSRSGATITAGRALGLSRETAVKYSFMAALPIIAGASVWGLRDTKLETLFSLPWVLGFLVSFVASFAAIKLLTLYVRKHNFNIFLYWRIILGSLIILLYLTRN